ncbi:hypothetical protein MIND_01185800 [Mycena indigotica]|uniref:Uncharacterized protein n=1 Tax=Mycena indigotica TaxID=2126181 RepID=A0A8H6S5T1_9AGAR|nr:uncharacterized protein MIND_01185800 [Mycena indigotica]KAF7292868.1 hypothetical protein MIND_01185800 [Mycena indigotica]
MSDALLRKAGRTLFEKHLQQYAPADPMYEEYTTAQGKKKRRRRAIPEGLSARDAKILKSVQRRAHYLDKGFSLCGFRFGWTFIIGIIPGAGDVADASLNYLLVVRKARKADLPNWLIQRMLMNNAASALMGLVPLAGDVAMAAFKANSRNAALLEEYLRIRGEEFLKIEKAKAGELNKKKDGPVAPPDDIKQIHPGAGKEPGEVVPGEKQPKRGLSKFLIRGSSGKGKGKAPATDTGRFVENVEENTK